MNNKRKRKKKKKYVLLALNAVLAVRRHICWNPLSTEAMAHIF
jgi:hypothetical protein